MSLLVQIFFWCASGLLIWRLLQLIGTLAGLGATEVGLGLPAEMLGVQLDRSAVPNGGVCGLRPVSVLVPFGTGEAAEDLARTLNALDKVDLPNLEILVITDLEHPRQLPLEGFRYEFLLEKRTPLYEERVPAPPILWEAKVRFESRLRMLGVGALPHGEGAARRSWRNAALNVGVNASRYPMVLWHPAGTELEPRALSRMSMAILARSDIAGVTATTLHRLPPFSSLAAAMSNLRVVRRERLKASWLGALATLPSGPMLWRRRSVVDVGGFRGDEQGDHAVAAVLEQSLRTAPVSGRAQRSLPVLGAEARRFDRMSWRDLVRDEALLLAERPRWTLATREGWRDLWRYGLSLANDRLQPAVELATLITAAALLSSSLTSPVAISLGTDSAWSGPGLVFVIALCLLSVIPMAIDLFVVLGDQLRFDRWSGRGLLALVCATVTHALVIRHLVVLLLWPTILRRWAGRLWPRASLATSA